MIEHMLKASLEHGRVITIIYSGSTGISERNIKVLELQDDRIKAYCYLRKQVRYFKLDSILSTAFMVERYRAIS